MILLPAERLLVASDGASFNAPVSGVSSQRCESEASSGIDRIKHVTETVPNLTKRRLVLIWPAVWPNPSLDDLSGLWHSGSR